MPVAGTYLTEQDCKDRLSPEVWQRILDDNADGTADTSPAQRLVDDVEGFVEGRIKPIYDLAKLRALGTGCPNEVKRICLDVLEAYAMRRHSGYIRGDWRAIMAEAREDLRSLRLQECELDTDGDPEPAANTGGLVESGDVDDPTPVEPTFLGPGRMGIF